ncbi:MAG: PAS domain S-box protein [Spirochaetia bacterium]
MRKREGRHQSSLEQERATLHMLFDNLPDGIFLKDRESRFIFANKAQAALIGARDPKELIGRTDSDFVPKDLADRCRADDQRVMESGTGVTDIEEPSQAAGGGIRIVLTAKVPIFDAAGAVTGIVGISRDITERKELERKNQQLATLVESSDDAIVGYDLNRRITAWNGGAERLYGYTKEEIIGKPTSLTIPPELEEEARHMRERLIQSGQVVRYKTTRLRKDGSRIMVALTNSVIRDEEGRTVGIASTAHDVTLRKRAEEALRDSERQLTEIVDFLPDATLAIDKEGRVIIWNKAIEKMTGIPATQMIGKGDHAYAVPFYGRASMQLVDFVLEDYTEIPVRYSNITREGDTLSAEVFCNALYNNTGAWVFSKVSPLRNQSGAIIGAIESIRDITMRRRTEEALRESEQRYRSLVEKSKDGIFVAQDGFLKYGNRAALVLVGYSEQELSARPFIELIHPDDRAKVVDRYQKRLGGEEVESRYTFRLIRKDGDIKWVELGATLLYFEGKPATLNIITDITERRQAEEVLQESERRLSEIVDFLPDATFAIDTEGTITAWNRAIEQMTGKTKKQMLGCRNYEYAIPFYGHRRPILIDFTLDSQEEINEKYAFVEKRGDTCLAEVFTPLLHEGKGAHLWGVATLLRNEKGKIVGAIESIRDITIRKRAEEEKAKLEGQLLQAQKMESVGRLAGGVAHDFNNMLGVILGHTEMALELVDPGQPVHADLEEIRKAAERSADLTRQLLAFARKQTVAPRVLDLNQTVEGMLTMLERLVGEDVHLTWQPKADLWPVMVDRSQIDQILTNLCVNARDAISNVGKIIIETENSVIDKAYCTDHAGFVAGEYVLLAVTDDGCGMDKETLSHMFEPFFTTKGIGKGTGLGLATVYGIVKQNSGFINVYSEPDHGTRFTIYLPRYSGKTEQARGMQAEGPALRGHETILLVEDEPASLKLIRKMLEGQGYTVLTAGTPGEAIRLAREHVGEIHLLMTDVIMPEMNGRDLARNLLSLYPHLKRLFASGYTANVIAHHGVLSEGVHFIQKPFSIRVLAAKVREALDNE